MSEMFKEEGQYSLTRILSVTGFAAFLLASAYLIFKNQTWGGYETFAIFTGGGGASLQAVNKLINSKYNTVIGQPGKPKVGE